ncbi:hypothetical protein BU23DRAFT_601124 [Bimuria novae-zelandiae CBS 107.79]|uniref:Uncharacterized protein n=1 Tax=Bimuria novae-zelandiae CBS 107.79 TaxID=1447943 RepID=A0A6A5V000_9PLEO|nr:hypothetical protein BU23DRAFT_601124 [Bimuria novae-zelandiae CBS 107.79]
MHRCASLDRHRDSPYKYSDTPRSNVQITGVVSSELATSVRNEIAANEAADCQTVINAMVQAKEEGQKCFRQRDFPEASPKWLDAAVDIERIRQGSSWASLVEQGGDVFLTRVAEIYFLTKLHIEHTELVGAAAGDIILLAEDALFMAREPITVGFWAAQWRWLPEDKHIAKRWYRQAMCIQLSRDLQRANVAEKLLEKALRLFPDDAAILKERDNIGAWKARGY